MRLLSLEKGRDGVFDAAQSLDAIWSEAETLGKVGVDTSYDGKYRATIQFKTERGSMVFAHGDASRPHDALLMAMQEALSLGAGDA